jgi:outer membrane receptor protein involved in Fe transport
VPREPSDRPPCTDNMRMRAVVWSALMLLALMPTAAVCRPQQQTPVPPPAGVDFAKIETLELSDALDLSISIATGQFQAIEEAPGIVSVITDEDIRRLGVHTLDELLKTVPGFDVLVDDTGRNRIAVRGFISQDSYSEGVLILFNGHRLNDHINGGATTTNIRIPLYNIRRVEIIRGPGSALFGTNAFVGVVNLIPFSPSDFNGTKVTASGGSFSTQRYAAMSGFSGRNWGILATVEHVDSDTPTLFIERDEQTIIDTMIRASVPPPLLPVLPPPASKAPGFLDESFKSDDVSANGFYKSLAWNARFKADDAGPGLGRLETLTNEGRFQGRQMLFDVSQQFRVRKNITADAKFSFTQSGSREKIAVLPPNFLVPDPSVPITGLRLFPQGVRIDFSNNSRRYGGEFVVDAELGDRNHLTVGSGLEDEAPYGLSAFGNFTGDFRNPPIVPTPGLTRHPDLIHGDRSIASVFFQDSWTPTKPLSVTAGVRYDHYNDFGSTTNPRAAIVWRLPNNFFAKVLYGRAFRAPTMAELNYNFSGVIEGNPALRPATINTIEFALIYKRKGFRASANYFANYIRHFVASAQTAVPGRPFGFTTFANFPGIDVQGVEVEGKRIFGVRSAIFANYTYQVPQYLSQSVVAFPQVPRRHLASAGATWGATRHFSISPTVIARGSRIRFADDPRPLTGYGLLNVTVRVSNFFRTLEFFGTANNLTNHRYVDPGYSLDYPRPGRQILIGAVYRL